MKNILVYLSDLALSTQIEINVDELFSYLYSSKIQRFEMIDYTNGIKILYRLMGDEFIHESSPPVCAQN